MKVDEAILFKRITNFSHTALLDKVFTPTIMHTSDHYQSVGLMPCGAETILFLPIGNMVVVGVDPSRIHSYSYAKQKDAFEFMPADEFEKLLNEQDPTPP